MADYPAHEESDVVLKDGSTLRLRPIRPDDGPRLLALYDKLSEQSLYFRFFSLPRPDPKKLDYLTHLDYENHFALVAEISGEVVAVARYFRNKDAPNRAEVAFTTADALHGKGIGTRMLERLAEIAGRHGIDTFDAEVLSDNDKMRHVFEKSGFDFEHRSEGGVLLYDISLRRTENYEARAAARHQKAASASVRVFFEPKSVAVVGASRHRGKIGSEVFRNLLASGFPGPIVPVNRAADSVEGVRAFARLTDVPDEIDLAVIAVPALEVFGVVEDAVAKGVRGIVVLSGGFGETGPGGRRLEEALVAKIRAAGIRMIGPNGLGVLSTAPGQRLNATFSPVFPLPGSIAFSSQSGALGMAVLDYARRLEMGFSSFVSVGNKADVSTNDLIQYWAEDPRTSVILLYVESFGNPRTFGQIARRISRDKPIVAVKAGRSAAGARAAFFHTGALAASDPFVDALFRQTGVIRTRTLEELFDVAAVLAHQPLPPGRRVAILTNAGGPGTLAADTCEAQGLTPAHLSQATVAGLRGFLPAAASVGNPVDMLAATRPEDYSRAMRILLEDEGVDSLLVIYVPPLLTEPIAVAAAVRDAAGSAGAKPVLATFMTFEVTPSMLAPVPCFRFPESAAGALARTATYADWRRRPPGVLPELAGADATRGRQVVESALGRGPGWLTPTESQELLDAFGIPAARTVMASTSRDAVRAAREIGYPVALKAIGPGIVHKASAGGVRLGLEEPLALEAAYEDLTTRLGSAVTGFVVQEMVPEGVEVLAGTLLDRTFGPLVYYASSGPLVELLSDISFRIHPLTDQDAADMLAEVKGTALLRGYRGAPPADDAAVADLLLRLSVLLEACPEVHQLDLDPVKVLQRGLKAIDARVRLDRRLNPHRSRRITY